MLCQICKKNEATVHFTRIINNKKVEMYICEQCAKGEKSITIDINNILSSLINIEDIENKKYQAISCEKCGMTLKEFNQTGKMGCPNCYVVFTDTINKMLGRLHGNIQHNGSVPEKMSSAYEKKREILELKEKLSDCIKCENYEQAAVLRDKINEIKKEWGGNNE